MGLFSKLFGSREEIGSAIGSATKDLLGEAAGEIKKDDSEGKSPVYNSDAPRPSGVSWGEKMPDEDNQFNYHGNYVDYFDHVFKTEFPEYRITCENARKYTGVIFIFWEGPRRALVVELLPEKSCAAKLRSDCSAAGIPYLRFYYDHYGWWNTYSYVTSRTRKALGI